MAMTRTECNGAGHEEHIKLDFLDLASPPLDTLDVSNYITDALLRESIIVYFDSTLKSVTLDPEGKDGKSGGSQEYAKKIFLWLHNDKGVKIIRQIWVSDRACGGDERILESLWDRETKYPLFSGIETFCWLASNISIRTIEAVAPAVRRLTLVWDGCSRITLDAWETDLNNNKLQKLQVLVIVLLSVHPHKDRKNDLEQFKRAIRRNIRIESQDEIHPGGVNQSPRQTQNVSVRGEWVASKNSSEGDWFEEMRSFNNSYDRAFPTGGGRNIRVAILDTGIDATHKAFRTCNNSRKSFIPGTHDFIDSDGHGTHLAGLVHKVAPNATLLIARVFDGANMLPERAAQGVRWAIQQDAHIISCSWGFWNYSDELNDALVDAEKNGILIFASDSNSGLNKSGLPYPAWTKYANTVGACDRNGHATDSTSPKSTFLLPGSELISSFPPYLNRTSKEDTKRLSGSSMATAIAAGLAARILEFASPMICNVDVELKKRGKVDMDDIFRNFQSTNERYVNPWQDKIDPSEPSAAMWLRYQFFSKKQTK